MSNEPGAKSNSSENPLNQLVIFLKAPRLGAVKTRLAKTMGNESALGVYRFLLDALSAKFRRVQPVELRFSPDDAGLDVEPWMNKGWSKHPQGKGDLGKKLSAAFSDHFRRGATRVIIIGSDCPEIRVADIKSAWNHLETFDLVLGPTTDGGYWLIGLRRPQPALFEGISWSTSRVLAQTIARGSQAGLTIHCPRMLEDIDTESDWRNFLVRNPEAHPPA